MKIQSKRKCWLPNPPLKWAAGEIKEVDEATAKLLLTNPNFSEAKKPEKIEELRKEDDGKYRTKKRTRDRS